MKIIAFVLLVLLILPVTLTAKEKKSPQHIVKVGDTAPNFTLIYQDGTQKQLSDLRGKVIMLQFTASWCPVCMKEMPFIEKEIYQKYKNNPDFVLVGIDLKEKPEEITKFIKAANITYPIISDIDGKIFELYAEKEAGVTRNIIIDKSGKIAFLTRLFEKSEFNAMKKKIKSLLKD
ncbi:MAG: TlpA disulfide reductase family protein [bacterium]